MINLFNTCFYHSLQILLIKLTKRRDIRMFSKNRFFSTTKYTCDQSSRSSMTWSLMFLDIDSRLSLMSLFRYVFSFLLSSLSLIYACSLFISSKIKSTFFPFFLIFDRPELCYGDSSALIMLSSFSYSPKAYYSSIRSRFFSNFAFYSASFSSSIFLCSRYFMLSS